MSKFYFKESLGFLDNFVPPHWLCLNEPQNQDVKEVSVYALNNLFLWVFCQVFQFPVVLFYCWFFCLFKLPNFLHGFGMLWYAFLCFWVARRFISCFYVM